MVGMCVELQCVRCHWAAGRHKPTHNSHMKRVKWSGELPNTANHPVPRSSRERATQEDWCCTRSSAAAMLPEGMLTRLVIGAWWWVVVAEAQAHAIYMNIRATYPWS